MALILTPTPVPLDRATGALLAHACGDALGAPLEFLRLPTVRVAPAAIGRWTDDTHMALYLGAAVLDHGAGPLDADRFGAAVGAAFLRWLHDPLTPSTAPGTTCLSGARRFESCRDWRTSGVPSGDGCGAVMRIGPLAIAFRDAALTEAADISARVTHAHPDAREAAIAGAHLTRMAMEQGTFSADMVLVAINQLHGPWVAAAGSPGAWKLRCSRPRPAGTGSTRRPSLPATAAGRRPAPSDSP